MPVVFHLKSMNAVYSVIHGIQIYLPGRINLNPEGFFKLVREEIYTDNTNTNQKVPWVPRGVEAREMIGPWGGFGEPRTINLDLDQLCSVSMF